MFNYKLNISYWVNNTFKLITGQQSSPILLIT